MIFNWLDKLEEPKKNDFEPFQLGHKVTNLQNGGDFIAPEDICIIYSPEINIKKLRTELFGFFSHFSVRLLELGTLKKSNEAFYYPVFQELLKNNRIVFVGTDNGFAKMVFEDKFNAELRKRLVVSPSINELYPKCNYLAYQRHLSVASSIQNLSEFNKLSLGEIRAEPEKAEPIVRDRNYVLFDLSAMQKVYSKSKRSKITGLNIEEACKIAKYIGHSTNLSLFHLCLKQDDLEDNWEETAALTLWYLLEGMDNCFIEEADDLDNQTYIVNHDFLEKPITFVKGNRTGRWWIKDPRVDGPSVYIPCEIDDYDKLSQGKITDKFLSLNT